MAPSRSLADLLQRTAETRGERVRYRFANGLTLEAEVFHKSDRLRILPLGSPQGSLMNHLLSFPEAVAGKRVFERFAGSGALGFIALMAGAAHVDFLDINPRAAAFHRENAALNHITADRFTSITADIAGFTPGALYDLLLATPPFVPTPDGIEGTITSNGGSAVPFWRRRRASALAVSAVGRSSTASPSGGPRKGVLGPCPS